MIDHPGGPEGERSLRVLRVTEGELQRLLLDLHDGPVQYIYAGLSQVELLDRRLGLQPPDVAGAREHVARVRQLLEAALAEIRTSIGLKRAPDVAASDIRSMLEGVVLHHEATTDTRVVLAVDVAAVTPQPETRIAMYRILQESLSNAYRHGGGHDVTVSLDHVPATPPWLRLTIRDEGSGFDPATQRRPGSMGLDGMETRAATVGGRLRVHSTPGAGTTVVLEVPTA